VKKISTGTLNGIFTIALAFTITAVILFLASAEISSSNFFISIYLDRWTHYSPIYAYGNLMLVLFFLTGIYLTGKHSKNYIPILLIITIGFPIVYTLLTIPIFGDLGSKGFSGIASGYFGYLVWMTYISILNRSQKEDSTFMKTTWFLAALATITIASLPLEPHVASVLADGSYVVKNVWAHYLGYAFGLLVPTLICIIKKEKFESCVTETGVYGLFFITLKIVLTI
jgi:hypothetical protein